MRGRVSEMLRGVVRCLFVSVRNVCGISYNLNTEKVRGRGVRCPPKRGHLTHTRPIGRQPLPVKSDLKP